MESISLSRPLCMSRLTSSIANLNNDIREVQAEAEIIETQVAYKDAEVEQLKSDRISHEGPTGHLDAAIKQARHERKGLRETFDEKKDKLTALKARLKKKEAKLAAIPPVESTNALKTKDNEEAAALLEVTNTAWDQVFVRSDDGQTFVKPAMLHGVPTTPISEDGPYWEPSWTKFGDAIDENHLRRRYNADIDERRQRLQRGPLSEQERQYFEMQDKRYQRFMNEAKVIKRWFCPGQTLHPNQVMAKEYLPDAGFCQSYTLYRISTLLNRLNALHEKGELAMQPLYFLIWRMSVAFDREPRIRAKSLLKVVIDEDHHSFDPILRQAVMRGAQHTNDYNAYGPRSTGYSSPRKPFFLPSTAAGEQDTSTSHSKLLLGGSLGPRKLNSQLKPASANAPDSRAPISQEKGFKRFGGQNKRKKGLPRPLEQRVCEEEEDSTMPPAKTPFKPMPRTEDRVSFRPRPPTESLNMSDETFCQPLDEEVPFSKVAQATNFPQFSQRSKDLIPQATARSERMRSMNNSTNNSHPTTADVSGEGRDKQRRITHPGDSDITRTDILSNSNEVDKAAVCLEPAKDNCTYEDNSDVEILEERTIERSPFPKSGRRVTHGFVTAWLPCTEREAMSWFL
ncbi:uncharacterized protein CTRU02_214259 [Colletotrichum truncatum]|uniref:Uncharacterized protein n=1 Tax=Colletotrichum truncatum TaxID=5467 RepID=A0ACC3YHZ8_COLTU|nr:uncharacterized protein CTRU02_11332 [Colletotrichum truncatum]KAF6786074.1 hypothetical protein CTRU02_11332 [Colletotrichum truncatum]